jgi:hypothetical protein
MELRDFKLALKEMKLILGAELTMEPAAIPGFLHVTNVKVEGNHQLLLRIKGDEILEVVKLHRKTPRRMDPEDFIYEVRESAFDGEPKIS